MLKGSSDSSDALVEEDRSWEIPFYNEIVKNTLLIGVISVFVVVVGWYILPDTFKKTFGISEKSDMIATVGSGAAMPDEVMQAVPFTVQAPRAQWNDSRFQDACEEASMIMANAWIANRNSIPKDEAEGEMRRLFSFERTALGDDVDASITDTANIFREYYKYQSVWVRREVTLVDLYEILSRNNAIIIAPMNGNILENPHYSGNGPERHMVVIIGYDKKSKEFITNDPGVSSGKEYRYKDDVLYNAIRDYVTGNREDVGTDEKNVMVVTK